MLTVTIDVCGEQITKVSAVRITGEEGQLCSYKLYDEAMIPFATIEHHYNRGAEALAVLMLNNYVNHKAVTTKRKVLDDKQTRFCTVGEFKLREG